MGIKKFFNKKQKIFWVGIIILLVLFLNFFQEKFFFNFVFSITYPFQKVFYLTSQKANNFIYLFENISKLKQENERLYQENIRLLARNNQLENLEKENKHLREELGLLPQDKFKIEKAQIIGRSSNINNWLLIDKGKKQGIEVGQPVVIAQGIFIGKVKKVFQYSAQIILISNSQSNISAMDKNTNTKGILKGKYGLGVYLDMVMPTEAINNNDEIVTVATDKTPEGLLIGNLTNIHLSDDHLVQQADVVIPYDLSKIHFVGVIK